MSSTHLLDSLPFLRTLRDQAANKARRPGVPEQAQTYYEGEAKALRSAISLIQRDLGKLREGYLTVLLNEEQVDELLALIDDEPVDEQILDVCRGQLKHARTVYERKLAREGI